jgi:hypothetical protein
MADLARYTHAAYGHYTVTILTECKTKDVV